MGGELVVAAVLLVATGFGLYRRRTDGRVRTTPKASTPSVADLGVGELGEQGTLLQFSSAFCAPCRATRLICDDVSKTVPGVRHIEIDAESNLDLVRTFNVMRTPTLFVINAHGQVSARIAGVPRKDELLIALDERAAENL